MRPRQKEDHLERHARNGVNDMKDKTWLGDQPKLKAVKTTLTHLWVMSSTSKLLDPLAHHGPELV